MVYVAIYTGLRVSELAGLRWNDIGTNSITIDERFCRGDWGAPKSEASNATIGVNSCVIERIHELKKLTVQVKAGNASANIRLLKPVAQMISYSKAFDLGSRFAITTSSHASSNLQLARWACRG